MLELAEEIKALANETTGSLYIKSKDNMTPKNQDKFLRYFIGTIIVVGFLKALTMMIMH